MGRRAAPAVFATAAVVAVGIGMWLRSPWMSARPGWEHRPLPIARDAEPQAAFEHAAAKRQHAAGGDSVEALLAARLELESLTRYSSRLGRPLAPAEARLAVKSGVGAWEAIGPGNVGGRTRTLVIHPDDPLVMYTGGVSGGVWKTVDGGAWWMPIGDEFVNLAVNSMALHPSDPELLFVGTGEGYFREEVRGTWLPLRGAGIFVSDDGGDSWRRLASTVGEDFHWVNDLVFSPHHPERLYAATRTGVWQSDDLGESWRRTLDPDARGGCLDLVVRDDLAVDWVFAACGTLEQATVWRLRNVPGAQWAPVLAAPGMGRTSLALAPSRQRTIYALSANNSAAGLGGHDQALHAVFRSDAGGDPGSWRATVRFDDPVKLNTLLLENPAASSYRDCGWYANNVIVPMGWYCNTIAVDPVDPEVVWAGGVDLFRSDDGGHNWGLASYWWLDQGQRTFVHADQHAIVFAHGYDGVGNREMLVANDGGVFRTANARASVATGADAVCNPSRPAMSWHDLNHNLGITQFYHGAVRPGGDEYLGGTQDNGTQLGSDRNGPEGWRRILGGDGGYVAYDPRDPDVIYAMWQWFNLSRSNDGGLTFQNATAGLSEAGTGHFLFIAPFLLDPANPDRLWAGSRRMWRSDDGARSWAAASSVLVHGERVSALAVAPRDSDLVLAGTTDGRVYRCLAGATAVAATAWESSQPREGFVSWLAFDPSDGATVYATYAGFGGGPHVWRSRDRGETWQPVDGAGPDRVPDIPVHSIVVDPGDPARLFLGTDLGVLVSVNGGRSWMVENTGFAAAVTESLTLAETVDGSPLLFAFTHGRGAWRVPLAPTLPAPRPGSRRVGG